MSTGALIAQIEQAFADVVYPGDAALTDSTYGEEPAALQRDFQGKDDWRGLTADFLDQAPEAWGSALSFFSDRALVFYLPAYLMADVRGELARVTPEFRLCWAVTPQAETHKLAKCWGGGTIGARSRQGFALFSAAQVDAIVAYLWWKLVASGGDDLIITQALENYWLERAEQGH